MSFSLGSREKERGQRNLGGFRKKWRASCQFRVSPWVFLQLASQKAECPWKETNPDFDIRIAVGRPQGTIPAMGKPCHWATQLLGSQDTTSSITFIKVSGLFTWTACPQNFFIFQLLPIWLWPHIYQGNNKREKSRAWWQFLHLEQTTAVMVPSKADNPWGHSTIPQERFHLIWLEPSQGGPNGQRGFWDFLWNSLVYEGFCWDSLNPQAWLLRFKNATGIQNPAPDHACFILASSRLVCSSFRRSFLFPTRMMGTLGQKCLTSGVHFSGMFSERNEMQVNLGIYTSLSWRISKSPY